MLPDFRNSVTFRTVPKLGNFVLLVRAACRLRRVWSVGGMVLTGENILYSIKNVPVPILSTKNPTWTDMKWNLDLRVEMRETEFPSHSTALKTASDVNCS